MNKTEIINILKQIKREKRLSIVELAQMMGVTQQNLSRIVLGMIEPTM